jgi:hypothetical protein
MEIAPRMATRKDLTRARVLDFRPMRGARKWVWLCALGCALGWPAQAANDPLLRYHPQPGDLAGLTIIEGSHQAGAGEGLTAIYNGGYERYTKAGVKRASQRYYKVGGATVEVVIHELKTAAAAQKFLEPLCRDSNALTAPILLGKRSGKICAAAAEGASYGYLATGAFLVASSSDKPDSKVPRALLTVTGERLSGTRKPARK